MNKIANGRPVRRGYRVSAWVREISIVLAVVPLVAHELLGGVVLPYLV